MARYVFITGGVVSSLGKGLASAALGALLQARGYSVRLRKLDPYLNVDPGTMSPFEHGEVFVTDDGAETDLDLGHYERFTGVAARSTDSVSSGRIYSTVLEKERRGEYLGKTIQVIPHVTNQIKEFLDIGGDEVDFMLCEIGGTVGDIEGLPFFEAIRQYGQDKPRGQCLFMHLTLLPYVAASGELKTKPTQHSVKELRSIGIAPDILVCRADQPIPSKEREKLALFCNVRPDRVIAALDLKSIYEAPLAYHREGLDQAVLDAFDIAPAPAPQLDRWHNVADRIYNPDGEVRIAVVGKYTQLEDAYKSISEALTHGGMHNRVKVRTEWIDAEIFDSDDPPPYLEGFHGILVPGGFGERGTEGKIKAAQYARENDIPYFGICLGMQMAVVEAARNMAGIDTAGSEEFDNEAGAERFEHVIYHMKEWNEGNRTIQRSIDDDKGGTMRLGAYDATLVPGSRIAEIYDGTDISERHRHRFEVDIKYKDQLEDAGLRFSGLSPDGELPEIVELPDHPWFVGVQFHPELKSKPFAPHPLFASFVRAAMDQSRLVCSAAFGEDIWRQKMDFVIPAPKVPSVAIEGTGSRFAVRRIFCVGRNYAAHAREMGNDERDPPFFFTKPADAVVDDNVTIPYPALTRDLHHEAELVVAIGTGGRDIAEANALSHVWGYGVGNDLTRRDLQGEAKKVGRPWDWGKAFDNSAICGPLRKGPHPLHGAITAHVNGVEKQRGDLADMIWSVPEIIAACSASVILAPGDLIYTGTPAGVGPLHRSDTCVVEIAGLGTITTVIAP